MGVKLIDTSFNFGANIDSSKLEINKPKTPKRMIRDFKTPNNADDRQSLNLLRQGIPDNTYCLDHYDTIMQFIELTQWENCSFKVRGIRKYLERFGQWTDKQLKAVNKIIMSYEIKLEKERARKGRKKRMSKRDI